MKRKWITLLIILAIVVSVIAVFYKTRGAVTDDMGAIKPSDANATTSTELVVETAHEVNEANEATEADKATKADKAAKASKARKRAEANAAAATTLTDEREGEKLFWYELPAQCDEKKGVREITVMSGDKRNYTFYYDYTAPSVLWVAYPLEAAHMGSMKRPSRWSYNPMLETKDQINLCHHSYNDSYARGHLIPNASRNGDLEMQAQTFYVTNSVPQIQNKFNGGIWQRLEDALQDEAANEKLYIVTGIAFSKVGEQAKIAYTTAKDDSRKVPIPNYFYKVVLKVNTDKSGAVKSASTIGFWFDHRMYTDTYDNYTVSVDQIEEWTGFDYFCNLPDSIEAASESNTSWSSFKGF